MRITFIVIAIIALVVGIYALIKAEYIIAFAMFFVIALQVINLLKYHPQRKSSNERRKQ